jgi:hypothetical protein
LASDQDARLLFWELVLPDASQADQVAGRLLQAGYAENKGVGGARAFTDASGITVELVAES